MAYSCRVFCPCLSNLHGQIPNDCSIWVAGKYESKYQTYCPTVSGIFVFLVFFCLLFFERLESLVFIYSVSLLYFWCSLKNPSTANFSKIIAQWGLDSLTISRKWCNPGYCFTSQNSANISIPNPLGYNTMAPVVSKKAPQQSVFFGWLHKISIPFSLKLLFFLGKVADLSSIHFR